MSIHSIHVLPISSSIIEWYCQNTTLQVDEETKNRFLQLKNQVEGWKKGTQVRAQRHMVKNNMEKIKENLSLYLNQISMSNFATIEKKITNEIENSLEAQELLMELILSNNLSQTNNLPVIVQLLFNLKYIAQVVDKEEQILLRGLMKETDQTNYDQMCNDNRHNLVYKNGFMFLGMIFNKSNDITLQKLSDYFLFLETKIQDETHTKELVEKYIDIYVDFIRLVESRLKATSLTIYQRIIQNMEQWKDQRQRFTNRARFSILDYLDSLAN